MSKSRRTRSKAGDLAKPTAPAAGAAGKRKQRKVKLTLTLLLFPPSTAIYTAIAPYTGMVDVDCGLIDRRRLLKLRLWFIQGGEDLSKRLQGRLVRFFLATPCCLNLWGKTNGGFSFTSNPDRSTDLPVG